jgi:hypothetical protein
MKNLSSSEEKEGKFKTGGETPVRMNLGDDNSFVPCFFFFFGVYTSFVLNSHFISNETGPSSPIWDSLK